MTSDYQISPKGVIYERYPLVSGEDMLIAADRISPQRTGTHARISLFEGQRALGHSVINVGRDEERVRLVNSCHAQLSAPVRQSYPKNDMKQQLDLFCWGLWDAYLGQMEPEELVGTETSIPPTAYLSPYIILGAGTLIYGPPGAGKSWLLYLMAVSIDAGVSAIWPVQKAKVLVTNLERSRASIQRRLTAVNQILGLPPNRPLSVLNRRGRSLADVAPAVEQYIQDKSVAVHFLDSLSRAGMGDLNENVTANKTVDTLNAISPTWIALGHTPRQDKTHLYGSIHYECGEDIGVLVRSTLLEDGTLGIGLDMQKANDGRLARMRIWALEFNEWTLAMVREAAPDEFEEVESARPHRTTDDIANYLQQAGQATAAEIAEELGLQRTNVVRVLRNGKQFVKLPKVGRKQPYGLKAM